MESPLGTALLRPLYDELACYRGKRVFFEPLQGNNGDKLIQMGSLEMLQRIGVNLVYGPQQAEAIIFNGGAGMTDIWNHGFTTLRKYNSRYPDIPLIVLPSSFHFKETDFPALFQGRITPAFLYVREQYSLKILQDLVFPSDVRLGVDHDMAFHLRDTPYLQELQSQQAERHILIVERGDAESVTSTYHQLAQPGLKRYIPLSVKKTVKHLVLTPFKRRVLSHYIRKTAVKTPFAQASLSRMLTDHPQLKGLPVYVADISNVDYYSFEDFGLLIAEAAVVVTTRLHVGILSAMLGKPTYLISGSYHKIRGIYEYSLANQDNVRLSSPITLCGVRD